MKRITRAIRIGMLALCAALSIASAIVSVRSRTTAHSFAWQRWPTKADKQLVISEEVQFIHGVALYVHQEASTPFAPTSAGWWGVFVHQSFDAREVPLPRATLWERRGFGRETDQATALNVGNVSVRAWMLWFPMWLATLVLALPPAIVAARSLARKRTKSERRRAGLCFNCGYDLRSSGVTTARCPECGTANMTDA